MIYNKFMEFWEFLRGEFRIRRGESIGSEFTVTSWADEIGVPQPTLHRWMKKNGPIPTDEKSLRALVNYFGIQLFSVLDINPNEWGYPYLPTDFRRRLDLAIRETSQALVESGLEDDDPAAETIATRIFERYGFTHKHTSYEP